jgi:uncharacterized protein (DUF302 family)
MQIKEGINQMSTELGFEVRISLPYAEAIEAVTGALKAEGFGVLTRIDVKATMKEKLNADFRPYVILGACNPPLAHRALSADAQVGLMLPCNVTVEELPDGSSLARIVNPIMMMNAGSLGENPELVEVAQVAYDKLSRVAQSLQ